MWFLIVYPSGSRISERKVTRRNCRHVLICLVIRIGILLLHTVFMMNTSFCRCGFRENDLSLYNFILKCSMVFISHSIHTLSVNKTCCGCLKMYPFRSACNWKIEVTL